MALTAADVQGVYGLLVNSLSGEVSIRKPAESALAECESRPGFCSCLLEIITARGMACRDDVRLLAAVNFKNCIVRHWRQRRNPPGISNEEKVHLRKTLLLNLREENAQIAVQLAVLISKIARVDYPKEWPDLFALLAQQLHTSDVVASHRIFMVLFRTLKELSTKRLAADQRIYSEITGHLFDYTWNLWKSDVQTILQNFSALSQRSDWSDLSAMLDLSSELLLICERWFFCLKIVRQLVISGCASDATSAQEVWQVKEVCPMILSAIQSFLPYYTSFHERQSKLWEFAKRTCIKAMKVLVAVQMKHPYSFGHEIVFPIIFDFSLKMITNPEQTGMHFEEFLIQCMVLVKSVLECKEYKLLTGRVVRESGQQLSLEEKKCNKSIAVNNMIKSILPNDRVILLCNVLIRRYFIYTTKDLDDWHENPELFHHEQNLVMWTERQRPCAEALFIVLFETHMELLAPVVVSILREAMALSPPSETELSSGMLLKYAAYTAAGHVYYELSNFLSFDEWFHGSLAVELTNDHPNLCIIHREIALVLGQWVSEINGDTRKLVYQALVRLLQNNDIAVRLAACWSLCHVFQESNFVELDLSELLPLCWSLCSKLIEDVQEFDSKVQVLNLISVLLEHAGEKVIPFAHQLSQFFQKIWDESVGESLLQIQLLTALRNFVCSLGYQSPICYDVLLPILQININADSPDALNLLEDSVLLWEATLSNAPSILPQVLDFFPYLITILDKSFDHLQAAVDIIEDYILFSGAEFLRRHSAALAQLLDAIVGNVNDKGLTAVLPIIDLIVQCFPVEAPPFISPVLQRLIHICLYGDEHDPLRTSVRTTSGAILARLLVMNANFIAQLTSDPSVATTLQRSGHSVNQNLLLCLADLWIDKIDNATKIQRKTFALALCTILTLRIPEVIEKLEDILSVCTTVIVGFSEDRYDDLSENSGYANVSSKELRRKQIQDSDPIKQLSLEDMLRENLKACAALHGEASFNAAISRIHPSAFAQMQQALKMG